MLQGSLLQVPDISSVQLGNPSSRAARCKFDALQGILSQGGYCKIPDDCVVTTLFPNQLSVFMM